MPNVKAPQKARKNPPSPLLTWWEKARLKSNEQKKLRDLIAPPPREQKMQIRFRSIITYPDNSGLAPKTNKFKSSVSTYSGLVTRGAIRRVRRAVDILLQISPDKWIYNPILQKRVYFKIGFVTLTFHNPEANLFVPVRKRVKVQDGNKLLKIWLDRMRKFHGLKSYVWKAEYTQELGLHYHITLNEWIDLTAVRREWNSILNNHGHLEGFKAMYGHDNPNSTDIHSVGKIRNIGGYIASYMSKPLKKFKKETDKEFDERLKLYEAKVKAIGGKGKIWGCSKNLAGRKFFTTISTNEARNILSTCETVDMDYCKIYKNVTAYDEGMYKDWKKDIINFNN